jgi:hypothetical protein
MPRNWHDKYWASSMEAVMVLLVVSVAFVAGYGTGELVASAAALALQLEPQLAASYPSSGLNPFGIRGGSFSPDLLQMGHGIPARQRQSSQNKARHQAA